MFFLVLTILCSTAIAAILKVNEGRSGDRLVAAGANYAMAALCGLLFHQGEIGDLSATMLGAGAVIGAGFVGGFLLLMAGIRRLGLAVPASVARLSMLIPTMASMMLYNEHPGRFVLLGIVLGVASFILLGSGHADSNGGSYGSIGMIGAIFVVGGCIDFSLKAAQQAGIARGPFLAIVFAAAALLCWTLV